jgi:carboxymethylenebutenolidase
MAELAEGPHATELERVMLRGVDGVKVEAIHARPEGVPVGGIALHPDIMGIRPLFDDLCRRLASNGFAVCSPEPFTRAPADVRATEDPTVRMAYVPQLADEQQLGDLEAAADYVVVHDDVARVAVMGFCMGGMYALKAAATGRFDRAVAFYGMIRVPDDWRGPALAEPLATAGEACPTLAIFGSVDTFTPPEDVDALRAAWAERPDCEVVVYEGAEHGFIHAPERPTHRADDAADAWRRVLAFLTA